MPSEETALTFGDVVLVRFPYTKQTDAKRRPAVVISVQSYNERHADTIFMPITSQVDENARADDLLIANSPDAGLLKPSAVKPVIATMEQSLVIRRLGSFAAGDRDELRRQIAGILG